MENLRVSRKAVLKVDLREQFVVALTVSPMVEQMELLLVYLKDGKKDEEVRGAVIDTRDRRTRRIRRARKAKVVTDSDTEGV